MSSFRIKQIVISILVILSAFPASYRTAVHRNAYELIWLIPFAPAFTSIFFGIMITMVSLFISTDSYKDPAAIAQAKTFLKVLDVLFFCVLAAFFIAEIALFLHYGK